MHGRWALAGAKKNRILHLPLGRDEERLLLEHVREGRQEAFEGLYRRFAPRVLRLADHMLRDHGAAADAAQETFLRVFRGLHKFRGESGLGTWIHRIATNVCLREIERRGRRPLPAAAEPQREAARHGTSADGEAARATFLDLAPLMDGLEPLKRVTFYLHHVEGFTAAEVAEILGGSRAAVLKRLQRTRQELLDATRAQRPSAPGDREQAINDG